MKGKEHNMNKNRKIDFVKEYASWFKNTQGHHIVCFLESLAAKIENQTYERVKSYFNEEDGPKELTFLYQNPHSK